MQQTQASLPQMHPATIDFMRHGLAGVLLTPTLAVAHWLADGRLDESSEPGMTPPEVYSTAVQNVTGHPAISVPAGRHDSGSPYGLQITAPRWRDNLLLDIAAQWEAHRPWPRTAPGYDEFRIDP